MFSSLISLIILTNGIISLVAQTRPSPAPIAASEKYFTDMSSQHATAASDLANPKQVYGACSLVYNNVERCETRCDQFRVIFTTRGCDRCYCDSPFSRHCDLSKCMELPRPQTIEELQKEYQKDPKNSNCKLVQVESKLYSLCPYESRKPDVYPEMVGIPSYPAPEVDSSRLFDFYQAPAFTPISKHMFLT